MTNACVNDQPKLPEHLWHRYRTAFGDWARQVNLLNQVREHAPENGLLLEAHQRTTAAEATYRESRDWLTEPMVKAGAFMNSFDRS
jgi:hypothetical protein